MFEQRAQVTPQQPGQAQAGPDIGQGIVGLLVLQAVGPAEVFQPKAGRAVLPQGPLQALGPQGMAGAHHVQQIPARIAVLPLPGIGVVKVAIQGVAGHLVVETQAVVAHTAGSGGGQFGVDGGDELRLTHPPLRRALGGEPGDQAGLGLGQVIPGRMALDGQGLADLVELEVGAQAGKLGRPVPARVGPPGLVVVPVEACHGHGRPQIRSSCSSSMRACQILGPVSWTDSPWLSTATVTGMSSTSNSYTASIPSSGKAASRAARLSWENRWAAMTMAMRLTDRVCRMETIATGPRSD